MVVRSAMVFIYQLIVLRVLHSNDWMDTRLLGAFFDKYSDLGANCLQLHIFNLSSPKGGEKSKFLSFKTHEKLLMQNQKFCEFFISPIFRNSAVSCLVLLDPLTA